ncbi:MAG: Modification methylase EcoRI [candidate division WWE3 bacterium GW2011_GWB1_44_4]|uniref:Modification methylase EcoRI n=1 Tax=candidate division WWE3 bacterium GW2011_GWB1_44_4 TaxID=1619116 RepID=A0A0G1LLB6_UNCKA|nr:MAG: Modification methylase EcoRI [candidate division WWE3 bacterium GW2011_GWB1_44_4]
MTMANKNLTNAKREKNDEFYTQYSDIQKEIESYLEFDPETFKGKVIYSNCDDPFESNFFRYFVLNFKRLGLKQLITTSYKPSPIANTQLGLFSDDKTIASVKGRPKITANKFIINEVGDMNGDGEFNLKDVAKQLRANKNNEWAPLEEDGDFRSKECIELLKQSDIVVTNPPFSLFREYLKQLTDHNKRFLIIGNMNALKYANIFPLIKSNKIWLGNNYKINGGAMFFEIPEEIANLDQVREIKTNESGKKVYITRVQGVRWYTNLDHGRRHQQLPLMTEAEVIKFVTKKPFYKYDNYDAIEVSLVKNIPSDYGGMMGVPISFLDKYSPEQFEIIGLGQGSLYRELTPKGLNKEFVNNYYQNGGTGSISEDHPILGYYDENGKATIPYMRIIIKHRKK